MDFDNGYEYLQEEIKELVEETVQTVLSIERMGYDTTSITTLFRLVHTLKGSCGSFGFEKTAEMIHTAEHLLDIMRSGQCEKESEFLTLLLKMCDTISETFQYDYGNSDEVLEKNLEQIGETLHELSQFHAAVHLLEVQDEDINEKTAVLLSGSDTPQTPIKAKPSQYELMLEYRGIIDSYKVTKEVGEEGTKLIDSTVGGFKKSLLEQLRSSDHVSFDFSDISVCDLAGLSFLRAIPQIVKSQHADLDIRGVSDEIYRCAQQHDIHLKKILSSYIRTTRESKADVRKHQHYKGTIIVTPFGIKELSSEILTEVFLKLDRCGQLNVQFFVDDIPLLTIDDLDFVCKWEFTIETTYPRADIEAILCLLPPAVFWDWKNKEDQDNGAVVDELIQNWCSTHMKLIELVQGVQEVEIKKYVGELTRLEKQIGGAITSSQDLSVKNLTAIFDNVCSINGSSASDSV